MIARLSWPQYDSRSSKYFLSLDKKVVSTLVFVVTVYFRIGEHARRLGFKSNEFYKSYSESNVFFGKNVLYVNIIISKT